MPSESANMGGYMGTLVKKGVQEAISKALSKEERQGISHELCKAIVESLADNPSFSIDRNIDSMRVSVGAIMIHIGVPRHEDSLNVSAQISLRRQEDEYSSDRPSLSSRRSLSLVSSTWAVADPDTFSNVAKFVKRAGELSLVDMITTHMGDHIKHQAQPEGEGYFDESPAPMSAGY